ncbi:protein-domain-containing protein [Gorgonomyces haynaldii]|nr:protein-domain-containing protein [Gorgonomyces haynaldii]
MYADLQQAIQRMPQGEGLLNHLMALRVQNEKMVIGGLFASVLVAKSWTDALQSVNHLTMVQKDNYEWTLGQCLGLMTHRNYARLKWSVQHILFKFAGYCMKHHMSCHQGMLNDLYYYLLRRIKGGDLGQQNMTLLQELLNIASKSMDWIEMHSGRISWTIYKLTRQCADLQSIQTLQKKATEITIQLSRKHFMRVLEIGQDFLRVIRDVQHIPEFQQLGQDLMEPNKLHEDYIGVQAFWDTPTTRHMHALLVPLDMELKLGFICATVRMESSGFYLQRFVTKHCNGLETLFVDLIRFICVCVHVQILTVNVQRWQVILYFFLSMKDQQMIEKAMLAAFYDWIFYPKDKAVLLNIESSALLMAKHSSRWPQLPTVCMQFLEKVRGQFYPTMKDRVMYHYRLAMRDLLEKGVIMKAESIFNKDTMNEEAKSLFRDFFGQFLDITHLPALQEIQMAETKLERSEGTVEIALKEEEYKKLITNYASKLSEGKDSTQPCKKLVQFIASDPPYLDLDVVSETLIDFWAEFTTELQTIGRAKTFFLREAMQTAKSSKIPQLLKRMVEKSPDLASLLFMETLERSSRTLYDSLFSSVDFESHLQNVYQNSLATFYQRLKSVCIVFADYTVGKPSFVRMMLSLIDINKLTDLLKMLSMNQFRILGSDIQMCLRTMPLMSTFEQMALWQILCVEIQVHPQDSFKYTTCILSHAGLLSQQSATVHGILSFASAVTLTQQTFNEIVVCDGKEEFVDAFLLQLYHRTAPTAFSSFLLRLFKSFCRDRANDLEEKENTVLQTPKNLLYSFHRIHQLVLCLSNNKLEPRNGVVIDDRQD